MSNNNISFLLEEKEKDENEEEKEQFDFSNFVNLDLTYNNNNPELLYYVEKSVFINEDET